MVKEKISARQGHKEELTDIKELVLFNDDFNTFEFVIETLIEVCEHDLHQAEQCAWITHFKGKCKVKEGTFNELKPLFDEMSVRDLTVSID
jgi:ATP-dependent Clp protease adaptor protein ClpS